MVQKEGMWLATTPGMSRLMSEVPESNTPNTAVFQTHMAYVLRYRDTFLSFFGSKRHRQQKWAVYIKKQKAVEYMCKRVTGGRDSADVTVAFGSARGPHMKGTVPAPVKLLHKALQHRAVVVSVDEFRTSVVCSKCNHRDMIGVKCSRGLAIQKDRARFPLYDVRACQNPSCRTVWNRNLNAARNILEVYLNLLVRGVRPIGFRR